MTAQLHHVALGVGRGDGPLAARLFEALGFEVTDNGPSLVGDPWYTAGLSEHSAGFFLVPISDAQVALEDAVRERLAGLESAANFTSERHRKPDSTAHVALRLSSLEAIEGAVRTLRDDPELSARTSAAPMRPAEASPELEAVLSASDVFAEAGRVGYLRDGVQVFVRTDLVATGLLALGQHIELNHQIVW